MILSLEGIRKEFGVAVHGLNDHLTPKARDRIYDVLVAQLDRQRARGSDAQLSAVLPSIKRLCASFLFVFDEDWGLSISCPDQDGSRVRTLLRVGSTWFSPIDIDEFLMDNAAQD
jgi:hypothetical protein